MPVRLLRLSCTTFGALGGEEYKAMGSRAAGRGLWVGVGGVHERGVHAGPLLKGAPRVYAWARVRRGRSRDRLTCGFVVSVDAVSGSRRGARVRAACTVP